MTSIDPAHARLVKKIAQLQAQAVGERNLYAYIRDLLTTAEFGIALSVDQVVIDSNIGGGRDAPDLVVYLAKDGKSLRTPDHAYAIFEVKREGELSVRGEEIYQEKQKYIQPGTRWFFLIDQERVIRREISPTAPATPVTKLWIELQSIAEFQRHFDPIRLDQLQLDTELKAFRDNRLPYAYRSIADMGRRHFIGTIREVAELLTAGVMKLIDQKVVPDLLAGNALLGTMKATWGAPCFDWMSRAFPIEFTTLVDPSTAKTLSNAQIAQYQDDHERFAAEVQPYLYALQVEHQLLAGYAKRMGFEGEPSLLKPRKTGTKLSDSGKAVESFAYETASLIVSRMLMVRFSEDHGFLRRYISNGGVEVFARYADYYNKPMQSLLQETYRQSRELYHGLFDPSVLDWALDSADEVLSNALLHAMYLLSRWDFRTVHGDILSGVYDHYMDVSKRRALGEVFTRPEIARYILTRCGYDSSKSVLDPACGTGTFLVEALNQEVGRLRAAGAMNEETMAYTLKRLQGLDINPFSVALAQIQVLWHLMDLFVDQSGKDIRRIASALIPTIMIDGGHSSLDPLGGAIGSQGTLDLTTLSAIETRRQLATVPRRFRQIAKGTYDIVVANPPYVRAHRQTMDEATRKAYADIEDGQMDLYIPFIYRALKTWLKEGGRLGVIVPIAVLEAAYAAKLRRVLRGFKIIEIVDLEALGKRTFRGIKRATVILVVEKTKGSDDDDVTVTTVGVEAYDTETETINFDKATRDTVKRRHIDLVHYLPKRTLAKEWMDDVHVEPAEDTLLSKLSRSDVAILDKLSKAQRLGDILSVVYHRRKDKKHYIERERPVGARASEWPIVPLLGYGIKVGGVKALAAKGHEVYKGQNIFPAGLRGEPMGLWDFNTCHALREYIYHYRKFFDHASLYAVREISLLPTACAVPKKALFQNTVFLVQLREPFPLNVYFLSRIPQWYAAKLLRASVIEDLHCHWFKRQLSMLPVPAVSEALATELTTLGAAVMTADLDIANAHRHVDAALERETKAGRVKASLNQLIARNDPRTHGIDLRALSAAEIDLGEVRVIGDEVVGDDPQFRIKVPDDLLRRFLVYGWQREIDEAGVLELTVAAVGKTLIPDRLGAIVTEIDNVEKNQPKQALEQALDGLDRAVGRALGLRKSDVDYVVGAMTTDPFLKELKPAFEYRGLRVQAYADHSADDRYA